MNGQILNVRLQESSLFFDHKNPTDISKLNMGMKIVNIKNNLRKISDFSF
ncbi:hypothetical protein P652_1987 [Acinetobacter baumannii UH14508]|uniref:Uncharacterized protein n=1 Tax=Acinetobacter baumannii UH5307 TaxID=1398973 RepID=A0ABC9V316_ACIBA|nr:hypothetical protein CSB68_3556 [Acinetobacter baumannii]ETP93372.1 hypothetical protein P644_1594 [Acinetobacter baumannii UH10107]ETP93791.1 hypothetical protein P643_0534 [Acinetobacter baumannii UH10007]ETQ07250.1 hypothetical protein P649_0044 [Acinetobacter baumannii UH12408]ETQ09732.1 hypothetical protein P648_1939 [Acinetobacter baumannii UH12308]ETQ27764.1 hypothetical protein P652_1987 [Acinetobacter baumannii UH14508]ETQ33340.1 hypothetical protein P653_0996 [Acinetobacter bauma